MSPVNFKKWSCRPVEFKFQGPHQSEVSTLLFSLGCCALPHHISTIFVIDRVIAFVIISSHGYAYFLSIISPAKKKQ